jgi:hypothetical protein
LLDEAQALVTTVDRESCIDRSNQNTFPSN